MPEIDERRWASVRDRDERAAGLFVYAVRTTGVYCRPGCASRRPRRENVRFFLEPDDADAAGFRPCKRCRPDESAGATPQDLRAVITACRKLAAGDGRVGSLAGSFGFSARHFRRLFREHTGVTMSQYARSVRAEATRASLGGAQSIGEGLREGGYPSSRAFYEEVGERLGMTAGSYRRGGRGEAIVWGTATTPIGEVLIAATARGVCAVRIGERRALVAELADEFPEADLVEDGTVLASAFAVVQDIADGRPAREQLPLDLRGTTFQMEVWEALSRIPPGETWTYARLAEEVGRPRAHRAAASACAANPVALVVPCHRIVRSDGGIGGYRWGPDLKNELLATEAASEGRAATGSHEGA